MRHATAPMNAPALTESLVQYGTADGIRRAIAAGADIEARDAHHRTPLMIAVESGNLETARALLQAGADVEARDDDIRRWTQRMTATVGVGVLAAMLDAVRDVQQQSPNVAKSWPMGSTSLHLAVDAGSAAMVRLLLDHGADTSAHCGRDAGGTVVERAVGKANASVLDALILTARRKQAPIVRRLLRAGADPNATELDGRRLLEPLVMELQGDREGWTLIRELVEVGAGGGAHNVSPAIVPFTKDPVQALMLRMLLDAGADVDTLTPVTGNLALIQAARYHDRTALTCLLEYGADTDPRSGPWHPDSPLALALAQEDGPTLSDVLTLPRIVLDAGADASTAMRCASPAALDYMLLTGADPNTRAQADAATVSMSTATALGPSNVRLLIAAGAELEARTHVRAPRSGASASEFDAHWEPAGRTALMFAAYARQFDSICVLLDAGADVHARSEDGVTALMIADQVARDQRMVQRLFDAGADPADLRPPRLVRVQRRPGRQAEPPPAIPEEVLRHGSPAEILQAIAPLSEEAARAAVDQAALSTAVQAGNLAAVRCLLDAGADPNPGKHATSALHEAVLRYDVACVEALLDAGADPNHSDWYAERPLDYVGDWQDHPGPRDGGAAVVRMLLEAGASCAPTQSIPRANVLVNWYRWTDHDGSLEPARVQELLPWVTDLDLETDAGDDTGLMREAENGDLHTARLLLGMGADPDARATDHANALVRAAAAHRHRGAMVRLLLGAHPAIADDDGIAALFAAARAGKADAIRALLVHGVPPDSWLDGETRPSCEPQPQGVRPPSRRCSRRAPIPTHRAFVTAGRR